MVKVNNYLTELNIIPGYCMHLTPFYINAYIKNSDMVF
jgi:hypothetical protein